MKEVILHIGAHKTGSTALQSFLHENNEILSNNKIHYPDFNLDMTYQHVLLRPICKPRVNDFIWDIECNFSLKTKEDFIDYFSSILHQDFDRLVVSTEFLFLNKPFFKNIIEDADFVGYVKDVFSGYKIRPVVYLRNPVDWIESCYVEAVKGAHTCWYESFEKYFEITKDWLDYTEYLQPWYDAFGCDLQIYCYENAINSHKDVISHFCDVVLGLPSEEFNATKQNTSNNPSPSREFIQLLLSFNKLNKDLDDGRKLSFPYNLEDILNNGWYGKGHYLSYEKANALFEILSPSFAKLDELSENQFFSKIWLATIESRYGLVEKVNLEESLSIFVKKLCELNSQLSLLKSDLVVKDEQMNQILQDNSVLQLDAAKKNQEINSLVLRSDSQISDINNLVGRSDDQLRELNKLVQKCDGYLSEIKTLVYNCDSLKDQNNELINSIKEYNSINEELSSEVQILQEKHSCMLSDYEEISCLNVSLKEELEYAKKKPISFCLSLLFKK